MFVSDHEGGVGEILAPLIYTSQSRSAFQRPSYNESLQSWKNISQFAILGQCAYQGCLSTEYNIAKPTNFAELSWPKGGEYPAKNEKLEGPFMQCTLPAENILTV